LKCAILILGSLFLALPDIRASWWEENPNPETWVQSRESLGNQLREKLQKESPAALKPGSSVEQEFRLWQWLGEWPEARGMDPKIFTELGKNHELVRVYLENIQKEDRRGQVLEILSKMQTQAPQETKDLPALAVAIALVFDQPFPVIWPHHQVPASAVPKELVDPVQRLTEMAQLQSKRRYALNLPDLSVKELKFLVDHSLPESEMEWARKNVTTSRSSFNRVFDSIRYDMSRIEKNEYAWPFPSYRLSEIKDRGGICVDQAYFAAMAGKAKGIPTLFFVGQGDSGGHAWFGFLESPGRWENDCGRYRQERYTVGAALDPQTWKPITDAQLEFLARSKERSETYQQVKLWTDFSMAFNGAEGEAALELALGSQPDFLPAWECKGRYVDQKGSKEAQKDFWEAFVKRFFRFPELRVLGQERLLALAKAEGNEAAVRRYEKLILVQNRSQRFDLSIGSAASRLEEAIAEEDWPQAEAAFRQALREFKGQAGGQLFYYLTEPFVLAAIDAGQINTAKKSLAEAKRLLRPDKGTLVARDLERLEAKLEAANPEK